MMDIRDLPISYQEMYEERSAIMQYDGGIDKDEAENLAHEEVMAIYINDKEKGLIWD